MEKPGWTEEIRKSVAETGQSNSSAIRVRHTLLRLLVELGAHVGTISCRRVQRPLTWCGSGSLGGGGYAGRGRSKPLGTVHAGSLDGEGLAHDGATVSQSLQVGHGTSARARAGPSSGGQRAKRGRRAALEEWAHGPGLLEKGLH